MSLLRKPFVMRMSEKFKIEAADQIFHRRSSSCVEERFYSITKILDFAAIRNRRGFRSRLNHYTTIINQMLNKKSSEWLVSEPLTSVTGWF